MIICLHQEAASLGSVLELSLTVAHLLETSHYHGNRLMDCTFKTLSGRFRAFGSGHKVVGNERRDTDHTLDDVHLARHH